MGKNIINKIVTLLGLCLVLAVGQAFAQSDGWKNVANSVNKGEEQSAEDVAEMERLVKLDKASLEKELATLKAQEGKEQAAYDSLVKEYESLRAQEEAYKKELDSEKVEIQAIEDNVRANGKDAISVSRDNLITAEFPERKSVLEGIVESKRFPGMAWIKTMVEFYFSEIEETGRIVRRTGKFTGPDGRETSGEILRIGRFTAYYKLPDGSVGFLKPEADGTALVAIQGEAPGSMLNSIKDFYDKKSNIAPIDLSSGSYFVQWVKSANFADWLATGGTIMYFILAVAIVAVLITIERFIVLTTKRRASQRIMDQIKDMVSKENWKDAKAICTSNSRVPTCQMIDAALDHAGHSQDVLENALQESILKITPKLERFIPTLGLCATIAPLLGLLGTVSGMIQTFRVITEVGNSDPAMLAGGISVALYTTLFGLDVAIPTMVVHHVLKSQVEKIAVDMEEKGTAFIITLLKQGTK
jgi:biopolymer transport protein ExbB